MNISDNPVQFRLQDAANRETPLNRGEARTQEARSGTFGDFVRDAISSVDDAKKTADGKVDDFIAGKTENVHEVMLAMEKANLSFQLMVEVRNRAIETYQEISRMQI